jgi:hypothetical protein
MKQQKAVISQGSDYKFPSKSSTILQPFSYHLKGLLVNTEVLMANVISMHIYISGRINQNNEALVLSNFHIELAGQTTALRYHIAGLCDVPALPQEWLCYADLWRIADITDIPKSLSRLADETDKLTALYERILPISTTQTDQATSLFLMADHLSVLNSYFGTLQQCGKQAGKIL